jgi:hypothetical protein
MEQGEFIPQNTHFLEAPSAPVPSRLTVAGTGGGMVLPPVPQKPADYVPNPVFPPVAPRATDGSPHIHIPEARIAEPIIQDESPEGHRQTDILAMPVWVEHKCGHLVQVKVWRDEAKRKIQIERIGKNGICYSCASGKK